MSGHGANPIFYNKTDRTLAHPQSPPPTSYNISFLRYSPPPHPLHPHFLPSKWTSYVYHPLCLFDVYLINALKQKHAKPSPILQNSLHNGPVNEVLPCYFGNIDEEMVSKVSSLTKSAGGPSQLDAMQYHHLLSSHKYKVEYKELRTQIAILAKKLAAETLDSLTLESYVSCRLIPLDKNLVKYIGCVLKEDIQLAAGPLQVVTGLQSGAEAGIYGMRCMLEDDRTDAVILVDIRNPLYSLNRQAALRNIRVICPQIASILVNTYQRPAPLVILGASDIYSLEATRQGNNLSMATHAYTSWKSRHLKSVKCV